MIVVYIAAPSGEIPRVRWVADMLRSTGVLACSFAWWEIMERRQREGRTDADLSEGEALQCARDDAWGIAASDVMLFLAPRAPTRGAYVELGIALGKGIPVVVSGGHGECVFERMGLETRDDVEAVEYLAKIARAA